MNPRRNFLKKSAMLMAGINLTTDPFAIGSPNSPVKNPLPKWRGFNLLDFFNPDPEKGRKNKPVYIKYMADWGFDSIMRIGMEKN